MAGYTFEYNKIGLHRMNPVNISTSFMRFERQFSSASQTPINARLGKLRIRELMESSILVNSQGEAVVMKNPIHCMYVRAAFSVLCQRYITLCTLGWFGEHIYCFTAVRSAYCYMWSYIQLIPFHLNHSHFCHFIYLNGEHYIWLNSTKFPVFFVVVVVVVWLCVGG